MNEYFLAKEIVLKKIKEDNEYYPMMVLSLYGVLKKFPEEVDLIQEVFLKTDIYIEDYPISQILKNHEITCFDYDEEDENDINTIYGISSYNHNFMMNDDGSIYFQEENPFLICSLLECNSSLVLNTFVHELLHLIKSHRNGYSYEEEKDNFTYSIRCGLAFYDYTYDSKKDILHSSEYFDTLDEGINVIETTEIMEDILSLKDLIVDSSILSYIQSLDWNLLKKDSGYQEAVSMIRPLWKIEDFKLLIENHIIDGNIDEIINHFDSLTYHSAFEDFADLIDKIDYLTGVNKKNKKVMEYTNHIHNIIQIYHNHIKIRGKK